MRLISERSSLPRLLVFPLLVLAVWGWAMLRWAPGLVLQLAYCPLRNLTGVPCPTCGGTHAALALVRGDVAAAFGTNPLVALLALVASVWGVWALAATLWPPLRREFLLGPREKKAARILAAATLTLNWVWTILRYVSF